MDPVVKPYESPYAAFANNPIWFVDPNGADSTTYLFSALNSEGKPMFSVEEMQSIANFSENLDRLNDVNFTKFQVFATEKDFLSAIEIGEVSLNEFTDLVFEVTDIDNPNALNWGRSHGQTHMSPKDYGGTLLFSGSLYMNIINYWSSGYCNTCHAGKVLSHERWTHGYMYIIARNILNMPIVSDYIPGFDGYVNDITNTTEGAILKVNQTQSYKLRGYESISSLRKQYVSKLFFYDKVHKDIPNVFHPIVKSHFPNKRLEK